MNPAEYNRGREERQAPTGDSSEGTLSSTTMLTVPAIVVNTNDAPATRGRPFMKSGRIFNRRSRSRPHPEPVSSTASRSPSPAANSASSSQRSPSVLSKLRSPLLHDRNSHVPISEDSSGPSSTATQTHHLSDQNKDDLLTAAQLAVNGLGKCASLIPHATGLDAAMSGLEKLLDKVSEANDNEGDVEELGRSVQELVSSVAHTYMVVSGQQGSLAPSTDSDIIEDRPRSRERRLSAPVRYSVDALKHAILQLNSTLKDINQEAGEITRNNAAVRIFRSKQDANTLVRIKRQIDEARSNFQTYSLVRAEVKLDNIQTTINQIDDHAQRADVNMNAVRLDIGGIADTTYAIDDRTRKMDKAMHGRDIEAVLDRLPHRDDASYLSPINEVKSGYLLGTRKELLSELEHWATAEDQPCIFILSGAAGTGKSTVAFELARRLDRTGRLGASFFFVRGNADLSSTTYVIPTIAYQLARSQTLLRPRVIECAHAHVPRLSLQNMEMQIQDLIVDPLADIILDHRDPVVIIIDALDECTDQALERIPRLLYLLLRGIRDLHIPIRVLLTTRPELHIERVFDTVEFKSITKPYRLEEVPQVDVDGDIALFFRDRLEKLPNFSVLFSSRPNVVHDLTRRAGGLFIWAATACRMLYNNSTRVLPFIDALLLGNSASFAVVLNDLDRLYLTVLRSALSSDILIECSTNKADMECVLGALALLQHHISPQTLAALLDVTEEGVLSILERLQSVANYDQRDPTIPFRPLHASFPQFLVDNQRCQDTSYYTNPHSHHARSAVACLKLLNTHPGFHRNILALDDPTVSLNAIDDLPSLAQKFMPLHVQYACSHWAYHVSEADPTSSLVGELNVFCSRKVLVWIEASSILGKLHAAAKSLVHVHTWSREHGLPANSELLHDAYRFLLCSFSEIEGCPEEIYIRILPFIPHCRFREKYSHHASVLLSPCDRQWGACLRVIGDHTGPVNSVTFSPNGQWIASASDDETVRMFDAVSGTTLNTMQGHTRRVTSVAISPDNQFAISGSGNGEINMWSTTSGALTKVLRLPEDAGRIEAVRCIAYSPDGRTVVTGSRTNIKCAVAAASEMGSGVDVEHQASTFMEAMLHIWDPITGECLQSTIVGKHTSVNSVAYSRDGARIVTVSNDGLIRTWDAHTLDPKATLTGHTDKALSAVFFPDGAKLASGSKDRTIRIWDATSAQCAQILQGHTNTVHSVAISSKGNLIASGSSDWTVRLWDTRSGEALSILDEHSRWVFSVEFSPEGDCLVSGSYDRTVRVWDLQAIAKQSNSQLMGHAAPVSCVAFSHDGTQLATGGEDGKIIIWHKDNQESSEGSSDAYHEVSHPQSTGSEMAILSAGWVGHPFEWAGGPVTRVAFSPDSMMLAASSKTTIGIWSTTSYVLIQQIPLRIKSSEWKNYLEFSPDSSRLYAHFHKGSSPAIWSCKTWKTLDFAANDWGVAPVKHDLQFYEENGWVINRDTKRRLC